MSLSITFGLTRAIPAAVTVAWGARFIFPDDLVWDRQSVAKETPEEDFEPLKRWLNAFAMQRARWTARKAAEAGLLTSTGSAEVILYKDDFGVIVASPNQSCGYLYVAGWMHDGELMKQPLPEYKRLNIKAAQAQPDKKRELYT